MQNLELTVLIFNLTVSTSLLIPQRAKKSSVFTAHCVAADQGLTGSRDSGRGKNIHGAAGMSSMPLFAGGDHCTLQAEYPPACLCVAHIVALAPHCGTQQGAPAPF